MGLLMDTFLDYAILSTDPEGQIESWSRGAENIFGYAPDEIIGKSARFFYTPEDVASGAPIKEMRDARQQGEP